MASPTSSLVRPWPVSLKRNSTSAPASRRIFARLGVAIGALLPVFFVLVLCYATDREKRFDADQAAGLNDLVLGYALPTSLSFVGAVRTSREQFLQDATCVLALFIACLAPISSRSRSAAWGSWR